MITKEHVVKLRGTVNELHGFFIAGNKIGTDQQLLYMNELTKKLLTISCTSSKRKILKPIVNGHEVSPKWKRTESKPRKRRRSKEEMDIARAKDRELVNIMHQAAANLEKAKELDDDTEDIKLLGDINQQSEVKEELR